MQPFEDNFPFARYVSVAPLLSYWQNIAKTAEGPMATLAGQIIEQAAKIPALMSQ